MSVSLPSPRSHRRIIVILAIVLLCISLIVSFWLYARFVHAKDEYYARHDVMYGVKIVDAESEKFAVQEREKFLLQAKRLREKWRPWAHEHREMLLTMTKGKSVNMATTMRVNNLLPAHPNYDGKKGITRNDLSGRDLPGGMRKRPNPYSPPPYQFTWNPMKIGKQKLPTSAQQATYDETEQEMQQMWLANMQQHQDFALSSSMNASRSRFTLWVSGRITEKTGDIHSTKGHPDPEDVEIVPRYDFLK